MFPGAELQPKRLTVMRTNAALAPRRQVPYSATRSVSDTRGFRFRRWHTSWTVGPALPRSPDHVIVHAGSVRIPDGPYRRVSSLPCSICQPGSYMSRTGLGKCEIRSRAGSASTNASRAKGLSDGPLRSSIDGSLRMRPWSQMWSHSCRLVGVHRRHRGGLPRARRDPLGGCGTAHRRWSGDSGGSLPPPATPEPDTRR